MTAHSRLHTFEGLAHAFACTTRRAGCLDRHGPAIGKDQEIRIAACPPCEKKLAAEAKLEPKQRPRGNYFRPSKREMVLK